jgi:hypothetical protein
MQGKEDSNKQEKSLSYFLSNDSLHQMLSLGVISL